MTKKPSYRFVGYTEPWEQRKLGECTEISAGGDIEKSKLLNNGKYPVIANALTSDGIVGYYNDSYRIEAPAVTVTGRGDVGVAKARNVNFTPVVRLLSLKSEHDVIFLENAINTQKIVIESTGVPQLTAPQLGRYKIFFPSLPEQTAIGSFFQDIDQLISLQQRKLEVLKEQKKTYLKLLFPAKGQTKPALRFAGFEDDWKEVKLGEVGETYTGLSGKTKEDFGHGEGKFITYVNVLNNPLTDLYRLDSVEIDDKQRRVQYGDVLFTTSSETPEDVGLSSVWMGTEDNVYLNSFCFGYRPQKGIFDLYYLAFVLRSFSVRKEFMLLAPGISRFNISKTKVMDMSIHVPSLPEQEAIGSFFQDLDKAIAKQEEKANQLKESKQTLLRKMFI